MLSMVDVMRIGSSWMILDVIASRVMVYQCRNLGMAQVGKHRSRNKSTLTDYQPVSSPKWIASQYHLNID